MDRYEITKIILSRIQSLDPENASKIMGYILIQDYAEKDMAKLAFGEETLLVSLISQVKTYLGLSSNSLSAASCSPSPFSPISNHPIRHGPFPQSSPKIVAPNNGFNMNPSSPSSPWSGSAFSEQYRSPRPGSALSYAAVVNGSHTSSNHHPSGSAFFGNNGCSVVDSEYGSVQVQDSLAFLDDSLVKNVDFVDPIVSPSGRSDSLLFPYGNGKPNWVESGSYGDLHPHHPLHRRSYSVNDAFLGGGGFEDGGAGGYGWRPCMYYARGFCKNGSSCKFMHGGFAAESPEGQVAGKVDGLDELVRFKAIQHPRFAAASQLMAAGAHPYPSNKINIFNENQRSAAAALMMGDDFHKFGPCRPERNEFAATGFGGNANSSSRQIYLTFPADSTFKEEDVSNYFSMYGPVQDVRIPCQQKRMFGFVTFVYPETVKIILAKGNPHFVCDSRVLVKPYKEKGKVPDKKQQQQQQQMERGEFSMCLSPSVLESREAFDHIPIGARMYYNTQELMLRRKIEQEAELQQALELQGRRLINLQLMDLKNHHHDHQYQPNLSPSAPNPPPTQSYNQSLVLPADGASQEVHEDHKDSPWEAKSRTGATDTKALEEEDEACKKIVSNGGNGREENSNVEDLDLRESLEHILPDNLFSSPTKSVADRNSVFSTASTEAEDSAPEISPNNTSTPPSASTLSMASHKSCYLPMSRFSSGQKAIEM